jgi:hypothetical protein
LGVAYHRKVGVRCQVSGVSIAMLKHRKFRYATLIPSAKVFTTCCAALAASPGKNLTPETLLIKAFYLFVQITPPHFHDLGGFGNVVFVLYQLYFYKFFFKRFAGFFKIV